MQAVEKTQEQDWLSNLFKRDLTTDGWDVSELVTFAANDDDRDDVDLLDGELAFWLLSAKKNR